jgi:hypothetical protein
MHSDAIFPVFKINIACPVYVCRHSTVALSSNQYEFRYRARVRVCVMEAQRFSASYHALRTSPSSRAWYPIECVHDDGRRLLFGEMQRLKLAAETLPSLPLAISSYRAQPNVQLCRATYLRSY